MKQLNILGMLCRRQRLHDCRVNNPFEGPMRLETNPLPDRNLNLFSCNWVVLDCCLALIALKGTKPCKPNGSTVCNCLSKREGQMRTWQSHRKTTFNANSLLTSTIESSVVLRIFVALALLMSYVSAISSTISTLDKKSFGGVLVGALGGVEEKNVPILRQAKGFCHDEAALRSGIDADRNIITMRQAEKETACHNVHGS